jgi:hypothetical protein
MPSDDRHFSVADPALREFWPTCAGRGHVPFSKAAPMPGRGIYHFVATAATYFTFGAHAAMLAATICAITGEHAL